MRTIHEGTGFGEFLESSSEQEGGVAGDVNILAGSVKEGFGFATACRPTEQNFQDFIEKMKYRLFRCRRCLEIRVRSRLQLPRQRR